MKEKMTRIAGMAVALGLMVLGAACGNQAAATTMKLAGTEGETFVRDEEKELEPVADMNLYSGYLLGTEQEGYLWIDLDSVKLAKMDENSRIGIRKSGKELEIELDAGSLFFQVTEPLEEDETMYIRNSNMVVGIRGTCGWVEAPDEEHLRVYILEGVVEYSITDPDTKEVIASQEVAAGQWAQAVWKDGKGEIALEQFTEEGIPDFVRTELEKDSKLQEKISEVLAPVQQDDADGEGSGDGTAEDAPGQEEPEGEQAVGVIRTDKASLEFVNGNAPGGVIVTLRDGLYGAVDLEGEEIVPNSYSSYLRTPNDQGQFALGDGENATVFDRQGNVLLEVQELICMGISENAVTYGHMNEAGKPEVCCYDIAEGRQTARIELEQRYELIGYGYGIGITSLQDGEFLYSDTDDLNMHRVRKDGTIVWTDEEQEARLQEIWVEEMRAEGAAIEVTEEGAYATFSSNGSAGTSIFGYDPGCPVQSARDGYIVGTPWLEASLLRIHDLNAGESIQLDMYSLEGDPVDCIYGFWPQSYYDCGQWYINRGTSLVLRGSTYDGTEEQMDFLIDFSRAQTDASGDVTNEQELVLAKYPYIKLAGDGYYTASDGEAWFYLDEQGNRVDSPEWADCSGFYQGYALVLEKDGMAYLVDRDFNKVTEGYPADSVSQAGGMFCIAKGDEQTFLYMGLQETPEGD